MQTIIKWLNSLWFNSTPTYAQQFIKCILWPLSKIYQYLTYLHRNYQIIQSKHVTQYQKSQRIFTIVVGNFTAGGAGKTPIVIALIKQLQKHIPLQNITVMSRGYGKQLKDGALANLINQQAIASNVGDEPYLIAQNTHVDIAVHAKRYLCLQALNLKKQALLDKHWPLIVISDDGLQNHGFHHNYEFALFNRQGIGNGLILPAGPMRERLRKTNYFLLPSSPTLKDENTINQTNILQWAKHNQQPYSNYQRLTYFVKLLNINTDKQYPMHIKHLCLYKVALLCGIAKPNLLYVDLQQQGFKHLTLYAVLDHASGDILMQTLQAIYHTNAYDICLITEKDAVKLKQILKANLHTFSYSFIQFIEQNIWVTQLEVYLPEVCIKDLINQIKLTMQ